MTRQALVTGVVGGIGAAIARRLAAEGHAVTLTDLPGPGLARRSEELGLPAMACDLGDAADVQRLVADLAATGGPPKIVVSAAGGVRGQTGKPVEEVSDNDWHRIFAANVDSAFHLARGVVPSMKASGWGRIVTISSGAGLRPSLTRIQAYCAAKHALVGLTKQLALELGPAGITVNSVAPGFVLSNPSTELQWDSYGPEGQAQLLERIHTRRLGRPEDIAAAAAFFVSDEAEWVTGQVLSVDGGVA
ncbi:SDR family NAD(P)-dependent oxidoreductase [Ovoidimarina sediminis]|uniref:SDR family NAD(P)-dependent oxidoreductase n=1 Tax=Ovoidimarina sediminis TaxID=3079856 RepID=UPI002914D049|nr:SDR family oxidoreductase [Rhodophyticola sp. MJ-SS7]MDU8946254.1 SDR family oxidoreductase [Rhodophyticola sp. MJ-SS7]